MNSRKYRREWEDEFNWLFENGNGFAECDLCGTMFKSNRHSVLIRHEGLCRRYKIDPGRRYNKKWEDEFAWLREESGFS